MHRHTPNASIRLAAILGLLCVASLLPATARARDSDAAAAPGTMLRVTSEPSDALVTIDRVPRGNTPLELTDLPPGRHLVGIRLRNYRETFETVALESGLRRTLDVRLDPLRGALLVHAQPAGASVAIDGAHRGATPLLVPGLAIGRYRVTIAQPGYQTKEIDVEVSGPTPQRIDATLLTDSATLRVTSTPPGAALSIGGVPRGQTPAVIERIPDGDTVVEVRLEGYAPFRQSVRLAAGDDKRLEVPLIALPGTLQVVSLPPGARVYLANQYRGDTPLTLEDLPPGTYRVRVELAAHDPMARDVELRRAARIVEEFRLVQNCGALRVVSVPAGVTVLVDGKDAGTTTAKADSTDQVSEPLEIPLVPVGRRAVAFVRAGFYEAQRTVDIERGKTVTIDVTLRRRFIPDYEVRTASNVYRGVLVNITPEVVRLETEIGIIRAFQMRDITSRRPLREDERFDPNPPPAP